MIRNFRLQYMKILPLFQVLVLFFAAALAHAEIAEHVKQNGPFDSVNAVTAACLRCHPESQNEIINSAHWSWVRQRNINGTTVAFSKKDSLAMYGISPAANNQCLQCHTSVTGISANEANSNQATNIDCLVCHDGSGLYRRGVPARQQDLVSIVRQVAKPTAANCITCHFRSCNLEPNPDRSAKSMLYNDVHLRAGTFSCQKCHTGTNKHHFARQPGNDSVDSSCIFCHRPKPHKSERLNDHTDAVACRTCHIPDISGGEPVLIDWNWLALNAGEKMIQTTADGQGQVRSQDGFLTVAGLSPVYEWDWGADTVYQRGDRIDPNKIVTLTRPAARNLGAKIAPFQLVYATQPYDKKYRYLISPKLSETPGELFPTENWEQIAQQGLQDLRLPFSGTLGFVVTATYKRINHGIAPADQALDCLDCHGQQGRITWKKLGYEADPWHGNTANSTTPSPTLRPSNQSAQGMPGRPIEETLLNPSQSGN